MELKGANNQLVLLQTSTFYFKILVKFNTSCTNKTVLKVTTSFNVLGSSMYDVFNNSKTIGK